MVQTGLGRLSPERLEVPAGKRIKLMVKNEGRGPVEFKNLDLRVEKVLAPGAGATAGFALWRMFRTENTSHV